ncbi:flagellar hook-associated protein 3 [Rheinheimera sediminis]|uniref:flagellar hook-associated protein FlgL n=1 Tax=Rheinheimera sp. YQF-1 TaxID=2499626 RepID=UPI000FDA9EDE|nr:flagellar hook-associated protein FlgL [Rheinheimera sp. YQF-1]RVT45407.1 flagellar hook-associated protein 3 [Rheinheimera sp. YQF-1]
MRTTFNMQYSQSLDSILSTQDKLQTASLMLSKQTKILTAADDPSGSARAIGLEATIQQTNQYQSNNTAARNSLELQETVLSNMRGAMDRARVLALSLGNGTYDDNDRKAIGDQLGNIRDELFDLMNRRDELGGYLFSGFKDQTQPYSLNSATGDYEFNGDEGQKSVQLSLSISIAANDSGRSIFDSVDKRFQTSAASVGAPVTAAKVSVANQSIFDNFYKQNYDGLTPGNNDYSVVFSAPSNYEVQRNGAAMVPAVTGSYTAGEPINYNGLSIDVTGAAPGGTVSFSLQPPEKTNILNSLTDLIKSIEAGDNGDVLNERILDATVEIDNASTKVDSAVSSIGGRLNVIESIFGSNEDVLIATKSHKADVVELDYSTGITELVKQETALQAVQATFSKVTGLSLFNYIR